MFERALPGQHIYGLYAPPKLVDMPVDFLTIRNKRSFLEILNSRSDWEGVIFNPCDPISWPWLSHIPKHMKVIWYRWGYEYYGYWSALRKNYLFQPKTNSWVKHHRSPVDWIEQGAHVFWGKLKAPHLKRVDYFVSPEIEEYQLLLDVKLLHPSTEYRFGCVGMMSDYTTDSGKQDGENILLGNSAAPSNNHIEAIDWISTFDLGTRKIITPLSYGAENYRNMVCNYGREKLGDNFEPLVDFMPLPEYQNVLNSCCIAVMNHLRQQGGANITQILLNGTKIFMNCTSLYQTYKSLGGHIYLINEVSDSRDLLSPLSKEKGLENKTMLLKQKGDERVLQELTMLLTKPKGMN